MSLPRDRRLRAAFLLTLAPLLAGSAAVVLTPSARVHAASLPSAPDSRGCLPRQQGYLRARLRGARDVSIVWTGDELQCTGDPRPDGQGFRMTFAGPLRSGQRLRLVFGIATPARAGTRRAVPANLTLIFEGEHRLYSTRGDAQCTIDLLQQQALPRKASKDPRLLRVSARGFCVGPASALDGASGGIGGESDELLLSRFDFSGLVHVASNG